MMNEWCIIRADTLDSNLLVALLNNEIGAIAIPNFAPRSVCQTAVQKIYKHGIDYYQGKYPKVGKIGITQSEHKYNPTQKEEYFEKAPEAMSVQRAIFGDNQNLLDRVIDTVQGAWAGNAGIAFEESLQKAYFAGLVRVINKAMLHYDWAPLYDLGWQTDKIVAQLTLNIYLQVGSKGGATRVYRRFGQKADLKHVAPGGYFDGKVVEGADYIEISPEPGELVFFNSQNYHEVEQTEGEDERITFSSFIGLREDTQTLMFWS